MLLGLMLNQLVRPAARGRRTDEIMFCGDIDELPAPNDEMMRFGVHIKIQW
jgi:hypothetical protein